MNWKIAFVLSTTVAALSLDSKIAIVGGSVSGLSTARALVQEGYKSVTILEAGDSIVPLQHVFRTDQAAYDMDIIYVPALHWSGAGVEPKWNSLLEKYKQELVKVAEFSNVKRIVDENGTVKQNGNAVNTAKLALQISRFLSLTMTFYLENQYKGTAACLYHDIAGPAETWGQWIERHDLSILGVVFGRVLGLYGNYPIRQWSACSIIMMLANKGPSNLSPLLAAYVATAPNSTDVPIPAVARQWVVASIDMPNFMRRFKHGYGGLFRAIVASEGINVETRSRVSRIDVDNQGQVQITLSTGKKAGYDAVVVTARPHQIASALPPQHPMTPLYQEVATTSLPLVQTIGTYGVAIVTFDSHPVFHANETFTFDYDPHMNYVGVDNFNRSLTLMRTIKTTPEPLLTVTFLTKYPDSGRSELEGILRNIGFKSASVLKLEYYSESPTPVRPSNLTSWFQQADLAQGHANIYFTGEVFSGHGVPTTFLFADQWARRTFAQS